MELAVWKILVDCVILKVVKTLDSLVMAMVIPSWKGMQESSQQMKTVLEPTIKDKKDELAAVQRKVMWDLSGMCCMSKRISYLRGVIPFVQCKNMVVV